MRFIYLVIIMGFLLTACGKGQNVPPKVAPQDRNNDSTPWIYTRSLME